MSVTERGHPLRTGREAINPRPIDLWDVETFDPYILTFLNEHAGLVHAYVETERSIFLTYDHGPGRSKRDLRPENPHTRLYLLLKEELASEMQGRTIRAYHYTRLTDNEVEVMRRDGIYLSTPVALRRRLDNCVANGLLTTVEADALYVASPFHEQKLNRADRFWFTSHPVVVDDLGVSPLLDHWGGEVTYMWASDDALIAKVQGIGRPRVIEVAVPLSLTTASYNAGESVLATFARSLGCVTSKHAIDICAISMLPPAAILAVHTAGQDTFAAMGRSYPGGFVDIDLTYWKDLTGEDE